VHKAVRSEAEGGEGPADCRPSASPTSHLSESSLELGQLLAIVELFATVGTLTRDQHEEIQSLSSWIHGWQVQEAETLQPPVLQFIRECVCECLCRSKGNVPVYALIQPQIARLSIH
jgi:hypothetical protein